MSVTAAAAEAFRVLRTNIQFATLDRSLRTLLVVGVGEVDASAVATNLALSMAEAGREVVLVDCNLRAPSLHTAFGVAQQPGLTSLVLDEGAELPLADTSIQHLRLLPSGPLPPNPAEILASDRMARIAERLGTAGDVAVLSGPPVAKLADSVALAPRVDGVLLVVESGRTRRDAARRANEQLQNVGARVLGVVLTGVK
jgi:non-specific protein-tyrosine kinase